MLALINITGDKSISGIFLAQWLWLLSAQNSQ